MVWTGSSVRRRRLVRPIWSVPVECEAGSNTIKINEVFPNPEGTDSDQEWIELYNAGDSVQGLDGGPSNKPLIMVCGPHLPRRSGHCAGRICIGWRSRGSGCVAGLKSQFGNASTAPDGIRILDCTDSATLQDTVLWGDWGDEAEDPIFDDLEGQTFALMPDDGLSIGRFPDGLDSDDNAVDFGTNMTPTPTRMRKAPGGGGSGGVDPGTKGCGNKDVSEDPDTKKCGLNLGAQRLGYWALLMAGVAGLRRRSN